MARPRTRWADGPDDRPGPNEIIGRLECVGFIREYHPGAGREAPRVAFGEDGELHAVSEPRATDLSVGRATMRMTVEHGDGRRLVARFGLDVDAPQIDADAPADLRDAAVRLWRGRPGPGRPSEQDERIAAIVAAAATLGPGATRLRVAQRLGRTGEWGDEAGDYRADVRAAGGWQEIRSRAGL